MVIDVFFPFEGDTESAEVKINMITNMHFTFMIPPRPGVRGNSNLLFINYTIRAWNRDRDGIGGKFMNSSAESRQKEQNLYCTSFYLMRNSP